MRIVFTGFGTRGDFQLLLALAGEMASHGHEVKFVVPPFAKDMVQGLGFECVCVGPDLSAIRDRVNLGWTTQPEASESPERMFHLLEPLQQYFPEIFEELSKRCRGADVLVSGSAQPMSRMLHETTGIAFVMLQGSNFGGCGSPALRKAGDLLINPFRRQLGLPPIQDPLTVGANSPQLTLYAMSTHFRPRPADWPTNYYLTGFFFGSERWVPSPALAEFIGAGTSPVVVSFGSMVHSEEVNVERTIKQSIRLSGCRAIIQGADLEGVEQSDRNIFLANYISHQWLFPRSRCVVLHGGAGTAAAVFRAGVPGIFVPHGDCYDHRYWAQLANEMGCATEAIPYLELTAERLASAIVQSINDPNLRTAAAELAAKIRMEQGLRTARLLIEKLVSNIGLGNEIEKDEDDVPSRRFRIARRPAASSSQV
jgi:sterol 3beta-glucosyltransferase